MESLKNVSIRWNGSDKEIFIDAVKGKKDNIGACIEFDLSSSMKLKGCLDDEQEKSIHPLISLESENPLFFPLQLRENTEYMCEITLSGTKEDIIKQMLASSSKSWPFVNLKLDTIFLRNDERYWNTEKDINDNSITLVTGRLNFRNHVGIADLSLGENEKLFIEVITYKLDYHEDFRYLLNRIADKMTDLLLQVGESTGVRFETDYNREAEDYIKIIHLRQMFMEDSLRIAIESIMRSPNVKLTSEQVQESLAKLRNPDIYLISSKAAFLDYNQGGPLSKQFLGYTPTELFETHKHETFDTPENRYIKNFLEDLLSDCQRISRTIEKNYYNDTVNPIRWEAAINELNQWTNMLYEWLTEPIWKEVGLMQYMPSNSQVLQKKEGYRNVLKADIKYQLALKLKWNPELIYDEAYGEIKPIYDLYEIWCYFRLREVLVSLFGLEKTTDFWKIDNDKLSVNLKKGVGSKSSFEGIYGNYKVIVELYYNRLFKGNEYKTTGSYSIDFKPDYTLYIQIPSIDTKVFIHFDAKYSFEITNFYSEDDDLHSAKRIHLEKMHAYKDAIRNSLGAYVLYPGNVEKIYMDTTEGLQGIGAYPLRPASEEGDESSIENFIKIILNDLTSLNKISDIQFEYRPIQKKVEDFIHYKVVYKDDLEVTDTKDLPIVSENESSYDDPDGEN